MSCSYYTFRQGDYYCMKKKDYVNSDVYSRYCRAYSYDECPIYKMGSSSGGCYLTSACTRAMGLADDCRELTTLRTFRDGWLKAQPFGEADIQEYYATAPKIVAVIDSREDAAGIYGEIYRQVVCPCVELIERGELQAAYERYKAAARELGKKYL